MSQFDIKNKLLNQDFTTMYVHSRVLQGLPCGLILRYLRCLKFGKMNTEIKKYEKSSTSLYYKKSQL